MAEFLEFLPFLIPLVLFLSQTNIASSVSTTTLSFKPTVATNLEEAEYLTELYKNGIENGVEV